MSAVFPACGSAVHAEWTKLRTLASTWWLLLAAVALTIAVGAAAGAAFQCQQFACAPAQTGADPAKISLAGVYLGQVIVALLAVLAVGGEYATGMIRVTLTAMPRRLILPARGLSAANGYAVLSLGSGPDLRAACGSVLYLALIALLAFGIATALRDPAVTIGVVLGLLYIFPIVAVVIPDHVLARHLEQIAPMNAGLYIQATVGVKSLPLTPWQGLGVLAIWAFGALLLGALVLRFRDA